MLHDLLASLLIPCPPSFRGLGYLAEAIDMRRRSRRQADAWRPHLDATRRFVLDSAFRCRDRSTAIILGSGLLLDVPLEELSSLFRTVVLMDVVCLPDARRRIAPFPNVSFLAHDVTAIAERLYRIGLQGGLELPSPAPVPPPGAGDAGLVVSLNILSQLWVVPRAYAARRMRGLGSEQIDDWCARVVEAHYTMLRSLRGAVCLVADHAFVHRDGKGQVITRGSTVGGLVLPTPDASWTWEIAPQGEGSEHLSRQLVVGGWHFERA